MKLRVLGCHGSEQFIGSQNHAQELRPCGFLVNGELLVDAGTISSQLLQQELKQIRTVLLSHLHFDHIRGLPALADNIAGEGLPSITVTSVPEVLQGLEAHIFNNAVYPNFFTLPNPETPVLSPQSVHPNETVCIHNLRITPIAVNHVGPAVGFLISDGVSSILYSGDTFSTNEIWTAASKLPSLKAAFIECSFPNEMIDLAKTSKHLTPNLLCEEVDKLERSDVAIYAFHMKPRFRDAIVSQLRELDISTLSVLEEGQELSF